MGPLFGLCFPGSDEANLYADCPTFEAWLGSFLAHMLVFGLILWAGFVILRVLYIVHTYSANLAYDEAKRAAERAMEVHLKFGHNEAKLYETPPPPATIDGLCRERTYANEKRINQESKRIDALVGDLQALKDKLGDPDAVVSQAVPEARCKRGRWLTAWVPFWP